MPKNWMYDGSTLVLDPVMDARASVARESDVAVLTPRYTTDALMQMGWARSYGARAPYRRAFAAAFVQAWEARVQRLTV